MKTRRVLGTGSVLLAAAAMTAACGSSEDAASGKASGGSGTGPIKLGFAVADSGPIAPYDVEPTQAAQLAVDQINAKGGVLGRKLEIVKKNTQSDKALSS